MIFTNFIIQIITLILGITGGIIVSWIAQEELESYKNTIGTAVRIACILTLLLPLLFTDQFTIVGFIAGTYCILGIWLQKEIQLFFLLAPLAAILCSANTTGFFTVLVLIFITTILSTTILLTEYTKNQKIQWNRKMWIDGAKAYIPFILVSSASYILLSLNYIHF